MIYLWSSQPPTFSIPASPSLSCQPAHLEVWQSDMTDELAVCSMASIHPFTWSRLISYICSTLRSWLHKILTRIKNRFPWIGEQPYIEMLVWQFSNIIIYIRVPGKMPDQHFKVSLFSNPGEKVLILVKSRGQICGTEQICGTYAICNIHNGESSYFEYSAVINVLEITEPSKFSELQQFTEHRCLAQ